MRKSITTLVLATVLSACGTAAASQPTGAGVTEDRSYDRIEVLRAARSAQLADAYDRIEAIRAGTSAQQSDPSDRLEQMRLKRLNESLYPSETWAEPVHGPR